MRYLNTKKIKAILSYLLIFIFSCLAVFIIFEDGFPHGHDSDFHFANIYDAYFNIKHGHFSPISANLGSGLGVGKGLFYQPLSHYTVALIGVVLSPFGVSLMTAFKLTLLLTFFISGIFVYRLGMNMSGNKEACGLIAAAFYLTFPYRLFDAFIRLAFAETFAFLFLPLFFLGLFNLVHMDKKDIRPLPFLEIILGASGLFLSHNLTAMFAYIFGAIYLVVYLDKIVSMIANKKFIIFSIITLAISLALVSVTFVSQFEMLGTGLYNISIGERMHTSREEVMGRVDSNFVYSGFLNINWLSYAFNMFLSKQSLENDIFYFLIISGSYLLIDNLLGLIKAIKDYSYFFTTTIYLLVVYLVLGRLEVVGGAFILAFIYLLAGINPGKEKISFYKTREFYFTIIMIPALIYLIAREDFWRIAPSFLLKLQFPWRLWAFVGLFGSILLANLAAHLFNRRFGYGALAIVAGLMLVVNESTLEKRLMLKHPNPEDYKLDSIWEKEINEEFFTHSMSIGASAEYLPANFYYYRTGYKSEYENSLYDKVNHEIFYAIGRNPYKLDPVFLKGNGEIIVEERLAPSYKMNITAASDTIIQLPLFYYDGYVSTLVDTNTGAKTRINAINIDGLVAFNIREGSYLMTTMYIGTPLRRGAVVIRYIGTLALVGFTSYIIYDDRKRRIERKKYL